MPKGVISCCWQSLVAAPVVIVIHMATVYNTNNDSSCAETGVIYDMTFTHNNITDK